MLPDLNLCLPLEKVAYVRVCVDYADESRHVHHIQMEPKQWEVLEKLSQTSGAPVSELIRRAGDVFVKEEEEKS